MVLSRIFCWSLLKQSFLFLKIPVLVVDEQTQNYFIRSPGEFSGLHASMQGLENQTEATNLPQRFSTILDIW